MRRRRYSHAYSLATRAARACAAATAHLLPRPRAFIRPHGRRAGRGIRSASCWDRSFFNVLRRAGSTGASTPIVSASIVSAPTGLIVLASTASAPTGSTALASTASIALALTALAGISFSSAAGVVGAGAIGAASRRRLGPPSRSSSAMARRSSSTSAPIPRPGDASAEYGGGCVIHKLMYDSNGKYVGERQSPQC